MLQDFPASMRAHHTSQQPCDARVDNQQVQVHVRCRTRVHRVGRTINRRLTMQTISQRGSHFRHAQTSILGPWRTLPTVHHPSLHLSECLHHNADFKVAQRCQHGIPYVVLMIFKVFLRRECARGDPFIARWE